MNENRIFWIALGISIGFHGGLLFTMGEIPEFQFQMKNPAIIEVTYVRLSEHPIQKELPKTLEVASVLKVPPYRPLSLPEPLPEPKPMTQQVLPQKKIEVPKELEKNLDYQQYYEAVRERIRFYAEKNYKNFESLGVVHLAFSLEKNGGLAGIQVFKEGSAANEFLIQVAIRSVKEAAPFPRFPDQIQQEELPFSVLIEFKRE